MKLTSLIRTALNRFNIDVLRLRHSPEKTFLGLSSTKVDFVLDVGANEGQFAKKISELFPAAKIYCFEPLKLPFANLNSWAATQGGRVSCFNIGLGDSVGEVQMHFHVNHSPSSSLLSSTTHGQQLYPQTKMERIEMIKVNTLDKFYSDYLGQLSGNVLLKLDVQGFEDRVLRGAKELLTHVSACLLEVCLDPLYENQANFLDLVHIMDKAGFRYAGNVIQAYGDDGRVIYIDALFTK